MTDTNLENTNVENIEVSQGDSNDKNAIENHENEIETQDSEGDTQDIEVADNENADTNKAEDGQWPKKAVNALANAKKQAAKYRERSEALQREIEYLKAMSANAPKIDTQEPQEDSFESYTDYLKAHSKWSAKNSVIETNQEAQQERIKQLEGQKQEVYVAERQAHVVNRANEAATKYSDYQDVIKQSEHINLSPEVENTFMALDDAPTAYYNLAKEGKLESLAYMPIEIARAEIIQAQYRNNAPVKKPNVSTAPAPIQAAKGNTSTNKPLHQMSSQQLMDWYSKK